MDYKLYHCRDARSFRVLWMLEELDATYELVNMSFPPRFTQKDFLEINPIGTVPAFAVNDTVMTESSAIVQYLAVQDESLSVSVNDPDYGQYLDWLHRSDATLTFPLTLILRYAKFESEERLNPQVVEDYTRWFLSRLKSVERALESDEYLVAKRFTAADICIGYSIYLASLLGLEHKFGEKTKSYLERLMNRDGFKRSLEKQTELEIYF